MENYGLFERVIWRDKKCIVTNAFACGGTKIQISPMGNGNSPAKYYNVFKNELKLDNVQ
jgi:hypothetical protein